MGGGVADQAGVGVEQVADEAQQLVDARVVDAVLASLEQWEQPLEAEHVPRIDERPAVDAAVQQRLDLGQQGGRVGQAVLMGQPVGLGQPQPGLADDPHGRRRDRACAPAARLRVAEGGEDQRQVPLLQLQGSFLGVDLIEMLAGAA